jgi:hypothetical protein
MFAMFLASFIVLSVWSAVENYGWRRTTINDLSGESYGSCGNRDGKDNTWWFVAIVLTAGFPVIMSLLMAWKTKDVEDSFSESGWIFTLVFVQFQVRLRLPMLAWLCLDLARNLTVLLISVIGRWNSIGVYSQDSIDRWSISWYGTFDCNLLRVVDSGNYATKSFGLV